MVILDMPEGRKRRRTRSRKLKWIRSLYIRDGRQCVYCGRAMLTLDEIEKHDHTPGVRLPATYPTLDHVIPRSEGGITSLTNLVIACATCNNKKGNRPTYVAKQQARKFSTELGDCPQCKGSTDGRWCPTCRGAGELDTSRYYEIVQTIYLENWSLKNKTRTLKSRISKLEKALAEVGDADRYRDRENLVKVIHTLKKTIAMQADRIRELSEESVLNQT